MCLLNMVLKEYGEEHFCFYRYKCLQGTIVTYNIKQYKK